jgi:hypothetical protein
VSAQDSGIAGLFRLAPCQLYFVLRLEQLHGTTDALGALRMTARPIRGATCVSK